MRVAIVQQSPCFLNLDATVERAVGLLERAADEGARLVVFPETWLPGYPVWLDESPGACLWDHPPAKALFGHLRGQCPELDGPEMARLGGGRPAHPDPGSDRYPGEGRSQSV